MNLTFFGHLEELRRRLLVSVGVVFAGTGVAYAYSEKILKFLIAPIAAEMDRIYFFSPTEAFVVRIQAAFFTSLLVTSPFLISQIWFFVSPALYRNEKKILIPLILITSSLFLSGALFSFFLVVPAALKFLIGMQTEFLSPMISLTHYIGFLSGLSLAFGIAFNLPVFIIALVLLGLLNSKTLFQYQRHAIVLIFIAAAILTPGPDIASQVLLALPLIILFEISFLASKAVEGLRRKNV